MEDQRYDYAQVREACYGVNACAGRENAGTKSVRITISIYEINSDGAVAMRRLLYSIGSSSIRADYSEMEYHDIRYHH